MKKKQLYADMENIMLVSNIYKRWYDNLLNRIIGIYYYENLPQGLDGDVIETILAQYGHMALFKDGENYYSIQGSFEGVSPYAEYNPLYSPRYLAVAVDEKHKFKKTKFEIGKDCVILTANKMARPTVPLLHQYALTLADTTNSIDMSAYNTRAFNLYSATSQTQYDSISQVQNSLRLGFGSKVTRKTIKDGGQENIPRNANMTPINDLIVAQNNTLRAFYRDLGISMSKDKSQAILSDEKNMDDELLDYVKESGLVVRRACIEKFNNLFGENVKVHSIFEKIEEVKEEQTTEEQPEETTEEHTEEQTEQEQIEKEVVNNE